MTRFKQQGSVIGYVMVGIVLAALVIGGIYLTRTQLSERLAGGPNVEQVADEAVDTVEDAVAPDEEATEEEATESEDEPAEPAPAEELAADSTDEPATDTDEVNDDSQAVVDAPVESDDDRMAQTGVDTSRDDRMPTTGVELPQTGVSDMLLSAFPVAAVIGAAIAYRRSNML